MKDDNIFKDIWKLLHSMKFGIILLIIISISSIAGTIIPQNNQIGFYQSTYSPMFFNLINMLSLHKVYSSWWFILMMFTLSMNLIFCSIKRLPIIIRQIKKKPKLEEELKREKILFKKDLNEEVNIEDFFKTTGFKKVEKVENDEGTFYFSQKNFIGYLGSWITHVALLIIILSYVFGKVAGFEAFVHGVPGSIHQIEGTDYWIEIQDFNIKFREDHTVDQYISKIKVTDSEGEYSQAGELMVNEPFRAEKMNIYQNGTGWAVDVKLKKDNEEFSSRTLYQSEVYVDDNKRIALQFVNFYPDYEDSHGHPHTLTPYPNNPKLLYAIFYEEKRVDMNVVDMGDEIVWEEYSLTVDNPQMFTLLQVVEDPGMGGAAVGGIILIIGIFLAFYLHPKELKAFRYNNGRVRIWGNTSKNQEIYKSEMTLALEELEKGMK